MKHDKKPKVTRYQKVFKDAAKHAKGLKKGKFQKAVASYIKKNYKKV